MASAKIAAWKQAPAASTAPTQQPTKARVRSVVGLLIHPFTLVNFTDEPIDNVEIDWWVKVQHDAGKLAYVTD